MIEEGRAVLLLVGSNVTLQRGKVEMSLPRKTGAASAGLEKATQKFLEACTRLLHQHVSWEIVKCLVLAGPGFVRDQLRTFLHQHAVRQGLQDWVTSHGQARIVSVPASSSYKHSLKEVLTDATVTAQIQDTKAAREVQVLRAFYDQMGDDSSRAFYGPAHVTAAAELGAVQTLLVSDAKLRVFDIEQRQRLAALMKGVQALGGEVVVFSSAHVSGEQLDKLSGVAALLRFPLPDLEDADPLALLAEQDAAWRSGGRGGGGGGGGG